jgi:hypothetical protein
MMRQQLYGPAYCTNAREFAMRKLAHRLIVLGLASTSVISASLNSRPAAAWDRGNVQTFAVLPEGTPKVEGLTVGEDGNVYVPTFDPTGSASAQLFVFDDNGKLLRQVTIAGSSPAVLGLGFNPVPPPITSL